MLKKLYSLIILVGVISFLLLPTTAKAYTGADWMKSIQDDKLLSQISIPGTHDSGANHEHLINTAKCQDLSIADQLAIGVRYLDIRCRHYYDAFQIHHGVVYQHMNFDNVINQCITFLNNNPSETIVMCIKQEHTSEGNTRSFEETFDYYRAKNPDKWFVNDYIPNMGEARGKIVLMRRFGAENLPKGINLSYWEDNATFTTGKWFSQVKIQDQYKVPNNSEKWSKIEQMYKEANEEKEDMWYINYCSGYRPLAFGIPDIYGVAKGINYNMENFFAKNTSGKYGTTVMDFATENRVKPIIATNFSK